MSMSYSQNQRYSSINILLQKIYCKNMLYRYLYSINVCIDFVKLVHRLVPHIYNLFSVQQDPLKLFSTAQLNKRKTFWNLYKFIFQQKGINLGDLNMEAIWNRILLSVLWLINNLLNYRRNWWRNDHIFRSSLTFFFVFLGKLSSKCQLWQYLLKRL